MSPHAKPRLNGSEATTVQFPAVAASGVRMDWTAASGEAMTAGYADDGAAAGRRHRGVLAADEPGPRRRRRRRRVVVAASLAGVVLAAGGVTAVYGYAGDIPRGTRVLGVELGGKSRAEAVAALRAGLVRQSDRLGAAVPVSVAGSTVRIRPADVGLAVDVDATVAAAAAGSPSLLSVLFGSNAVAPVVTIDAARLDVALRPVAAKVARPARMPAVVFKGTTPKPVYPRPGTGLDPQRSAQAVRDGWVSGQPVTVPLVDVIPVMTGQDVDRLVTELARPAVAGPVTVTTDRGSFSVPPTAIAKSLVLTADKTGKVSPRVDAKKLRAALADQLATVEVRPKEATVAVAGGKPRVVASSGGRQVDTAALSAGLLAVLPKRDGRQVAGVLKTVEPKTTTSDLSRLGIKQRVSTFTTTFSGGRSTPRSHNIYRIADEVDGAVVKPGEVFALNGHTGVRGYAQGYKDAPIIQGGKLVPGVGGGASQFTTTLFNAAYYAGLEDVEHKPHSYWFSRYPPVIESTIFYPTLDLKFRNDTPYGVLIDTSHTASSVTVSMWSTRVFDSVTTRWSKRRNITQPQTVHLTPGPRCIATTGLIGFTQDAWRVFRKGGNEVRREKFTWRYAPEPRYVCANEPS